jgi:predicted lipase
MYESFKDEMLEYIDTLKVQYPDASILMTGHSLGAALSTLATYDLKRKYTTTDIKIYNFGSPRVGNKAFTTQFK